MGCTYGGAGGGREGGRSVDEVDDAVGDGDVGLHDVGDDMLATVMPVALNCVRFHLN